MIVYEGKKIIIMSCSFCNIKCKHCYINYSGNISPELLLELVNNFKNKYSIMINGTEPILNEQYFDSFSENKQDYILTNGLVLLGNARLREKLLEKGIRRVSISYHFDIHDSLSQTSKETIEGVIRELNDSGFSTRILTTISSKNYDKVIQYCKCASSLGAKAIKFTNFINQGRAREFNGSNTLTANMITLFFEQLSLARSIYNKDSLLIERCGSFGRDPTPHDTGNFMCPAGIDNVVLTPDGKVYPCIFLMEEEDQIGYYDKNSIYVDETRIHNDGQKCLALKRNYK